MYQATLIFLTGFLTLCFMGCQPTSQPKPVPEVLIHYMSWYGDEEPGVDSLRHWKFGHANTPLVGYYDSHKKSTHYYHLLLAWSAGIDGIVVNVKDEYDRIGMERALEVIRELDQLATDEFDFKIAISFDDQGFDLEAPLDTALTKIQNFKRDFVQDNKYYLRHNGKPIIFSFDYPKKFLTARGLRESLDSIFGKRQAYLVWNTFGEGENTQEYVDAFYPWVQPGGPWDPEGKNWGKPYLDYFYPQVNDFENQAYEFVGGGVWPGFDDRKNTSWGANRLISRGGGSTYDSTWYLVQNYQGEIPMEYVMIETWNDWNEGTEIEPSVENGFQNLTQTAQQVSLLQGKDAKPDPLAYGVVVDLYEALRSAEEDSAEVPKFVAEAIGLFLQGKHKEVDNKISAN